MPRFTLATQDTELTGLGMDQFATCTWDAFKICPLLMSSITLCRWSLRKPQELGFKGI